MHTCAVILRGESFRFGRQDTRIRGIPYAVEDQMLACRSHLRICDRLKEMGVTPSLFLTTYTTPYNEQLLEVYEPYLVKHQILPAIGPIQHMNIKASVDLVGDLSIFDYIIIIRVDVFFKDEFFEIFKLDENRILFVSVCWYKGCRTSRGFPRVNDTYYCFPKLLIRYLFAAQGHSQSYGHECVEHLNLRQHEYDFLTNIFLDSDSYKDKNPYYRIVNRPESEIFHSPGKIFPRDFARAKLIHINFRPPNFMPRNSISRNATPPDAALPDAAPPDAVPPDAVPRVVTPREYNQRKSNLPGARRRGFKAVEK